MAHEHNYKLTAVWTGNKGDGTKNVRTYDRSHTVSIQGKPELFLQQIILLLETNQN
jgi:hypothetical protein